MDYAENLVQALHSFLHLAWTRVIDCTSFLASCYEVLKSIFALFRRTICPTAAIHYVSNKIPVGYMCRRLSDETQRQLLQRLQCL